MRQPDPARRAAVGALAAGVFGLAPRLSTAREAAMLERPIPRSGERIPVVGMGTWQTFDVGAAERERAPLRAVLRRFVELGGRVLDSSPMYGRAERVLGDLAAEPGLAGRLFLATKVWTAGRAAGIAQMEDSFRLLRTGTIDLMQVHNLLDTDVHLPQLRDWKQSGRLRYLGITHYHAGAHRDLERLVATRTFDFVQFNYSLQEREAEARLLGACAESGTAVIVNRPYAMGDVFRRVRGKALPPWAAEFDCTSWGRFFLKYLLGHPAVTCVIPATDNPEHVADNMGAGLGRLPDAAQRRRMAAHFDGL